MVMCISNKSGSPETLFSSHITKSFYQTVRDIIWNWEVTGKVSLHYINVLLSDCDLWSRNVDI